MPILNASHVKDFIANAMSNDYDYEAVPGTIKVVADPQVAGTFAARFADANAEGDTVDLLFITADYHRDVDNVDILLSETLEEVEYESWPPRSGSLKFF